ncbi:MAG: DNA-3-methyladenine glycosylase [Geobacteraceae bacterium]
MPGIVNDQDIGKLKKKDRRISFAIEKHGIPPNWKRDPGFVSLSRVILEQQVSLESANAHFKKLNDYLKSFSPEEIVKLTDGEMRECQISRQKASYLRTLAKAIIDNHLNLDDFAAMDEDAIRKDLMAIRGIGKWTSDIYLMFCLQRKDIFPLGDIAVVKTVKELYKIESSEEILAVSEKWRPFRSLGSYCMWNYYLKSRNR